MLKLQDISAIPSDAAELLEAVGYLDADDLVQADIAELYDELLKANEKLSIFSGSLTEEDVKSWQQSLNNEGIAVPDTPEEVSAEKESGEAEEPEETEEEPEEEPEQTPELSNFENDPEIMEMLGTSPEAELLPGSLIKRNELAVKDIPEGILLTSCENDLEINIQARAKTREHQRQDSDAERTGLATSRIRNFEQMDTEEHSVKPLDRGTPREAVSLSEGLNKGLSPESRRFIRGVLHPDVMRVRVSALATTFVMIAMIASFVGIPWLLIHEHRSGDSMLWWVVGIASTLLISGLCYLFWGINARCRICGQRHFAPKKCLKNKKAHHIPLVGYILPTALQALLFKWFYCTYCGTAVRLKK